MSFLHDDAVSGVSLALVDWRRWWFGGRVLVMSLALNSRAAFAAQVARVARCFSCCVLHVLPLSKVSFARDWFTVRFAMVDVLFSHLFGVRSL